VARTTSLRRMKADVEELTAAAAGAEEELRRKAFALGQRLFAGKTKQFSRYLRAVLTAHESVKRASRHRRAASIA
jgi:hypothetical protein